MPKGEYNRQKRGDSYKIDIPFENQSPAWAKALVVFAVYDKQGITRKELEAFGINRNTWYCIRKKFLKEDFIEADKSQTYKHDIRVYKTKKLWTKITERIQQELLKKLSELEPFDYRAWLKKQKTSITRKSQKYPMNSLVNQEKMLLYPAYTYAKKQQNLPLKKIENAKNNISIFFSKKKNTDWLQQQFRRFLYSKLSGLAIIHKRLRNFDYYIEQFLLDTAVKNIHYKHYTQNKLFEDIARIYSQPEEAFFLYYNREAEAKEYEMFLKAEEKQKTKLFAKNQDEYYRQYPEELPEEPTDCAFCDQALNGEYQLSVNKHSYICNQCYKKEKNRR